jgi:transposase
MKAALTGGLCALRFRLIIIFMPCQQIGRHPYEPFFASRAPASGEVREQRTHIAAHAGHRQRTFRDGPEDCCGSHRQRPPGLCDKRFTFAYIFAAVEPGTDNAFALVMPYADTEAMQEFLNRFAETIAADEHAVMILDQAGWHRSNDLVVPDNITLVPLPPYSPELNPVERVWLYLKERFLSHRLLDDYDAIVTAACKAWNRLVAEAGRITSLCSYPWIPKVNA